MAQPHPEGMPDRLRARLAADAQGLPEPFDATDALHVDKAAAALLKRFFAENDPKCFELLVELTLPILNGAAEDVSREEGLAAGAQTLLTPLFTQIFVSLRPPAGLLDAPFLGWMVGQAREGARQRVAALAARKIPIAETDGIVDTTPAEPRASRQSEGPVEPQPGTVLARLTEAVAASGQLDLTPLGLSLGGIVEIVFHRLPIEHRRILRCVEVAHMSDVNAALFLNIPEGEVQSRCATARGELQAGVRAILDQLSESLTCALKGTDLTTVSPEHLAEHLVGCETCTGNVELMHSLGDVPGWLKSVEKSPGDASRVEQVLASANGRGTEELSRLLYEMFRACMAAVDPHRIRLIESPDSLDHLTEAASVMTARRGDSSSTEPGSHIAGAAGCLNLLELVDPGSLRASWARGQLLIAQGDFTEALRIFESIAGSRGLDPTLGGSARVATLRCHLALGNIDSVVRVSEGLISSGSQQKWASMYLVWASAEKRDRALFDRASTLFKAAIEPAGQAQWWSELVEADAAWIAERLSMAHDDVILALGGSRP